MTTHNAHEYFGFSGWDDVLGNFDASKFPEPELVYAVYSTPAYDGSADVIYRDSGQWYHANGGHCSCYGLEGQWEPETVDPEVHLDGLKQGKTYLLVSGSERDYPQATQENFNSWLKWAVTQ